MKKIFLLSVAVLLFSSAFSQKKALDSLRNTYKRGFMINPFSFFVGGFELGYGMMNSRMREAKIYAGYYFLENPGPYNDRDNNSTITTNPNATTFKNMEGARFEVQYLFFRPAEDALRYFVGGYATFKTIKMDVSKVNNTSGGSSTIRTDYTARGSALGVGIVLGIRGYIMDNLFVDIYTGGGINFSLDHRYEDDVNLDVVNPYKKAIIPRGGLSLGIAF